MKIITGVPESVSVEGQTVRFVWLSVGDGEPVALTLSKYDFVLMIEKLMDAVGDTADV